MDIKGNKITGFLHKKKPKDAEEPQKSDVKVEKLSKPKNEEMPRPSNISELVEKHMVSKMKMDPTLVHLLWSIRRKSPKGEGIFDFRIYDEPEVLLKRVTVKNYNSLDEHPDLILYEGWFNQQAKQVEVTTRREIALTPILTRDEILKQIETLTEPGSTISFFLSRGPSLGGPLGRGAFVVEINPNYPSKGKKYNCYSVNVIGMELAPKGPKLWDSDKPKDIAKWVKDCHNKRGY